MKPSKEVQFHILKRFIIENGVEAFLDRDKRPIKNPDVDVCHDLGMWYGGVIETARPIWENQSS